MSPSKPIAYESSDKPLELTTPRQSEDKAKIAEKIQSKKYQSDGVENNKKHQNAEFGSSNFTAEKLANSSIPSNPLTESSSVGSEILPPTPPIWYPPLYPPHPPYGIDPLHFFIDLRVSKMAIKVFCIRFGRKQIRGSKIFGARGRAKTKKLFLV